MAAKPHLRPVGDNEVARRKSVSEAAKSGDRRELLVAMRDRIAQTISGDCPPRDLAALTRRLQDIAKDIEQIDLAGSGEGSVVATTDDEDFDATSV
jgi:hypothetical protein